MSDDIDAAQDMDARIRAAEVAAVRDATRGPGSDECEDCARPIPQERQRAVPWATRCIGCQEAAERHARGMTCRIG